MALSQRPTPRTSPGRGKLWLLALLAAAAALLGGCGGGAAAGPSTLVEGGQRAFDARLAELRGRPVVVNQWASWCGPCRTEFPHFRAQAAKRGDAVAFLGVNAMDSRSAATKFLAEQPTGFEHFYDKDAKIARSFGGGRVWPATAFYDTRGKVVYVRQGTYATEQDLADDIDRYALGG